MKKYNIIYADCPWSYNDKALAGKRGACCKYPVMDTNDLCALKVSSITDSDCVLFLWVTMPKLNESFDLIKAWGFQYKTCGFVWVKTIKNNDINQSGFFPEDSFKSFFGMGNWTRANAELCLLAIKGKPQRKRADISQLIYSPIEQHSKKPDKVREKIVQLIGDLPRLELFARERVSGWTSLGYDIDGMDIRESLGKLIKEAV